MVALSTEEHVDILISSLKDSFYSSVSDKEKLAGCIFHSQPGNGAVILE